MVPSREELERTLSNLPYISANGLLLNEQKALRVRAVMLRINGGAISLLEKQVDRVEGEVRKQVARNDEDEVTLTPIELRGIIARAAIRGFAQAHVSTAESLEETKLFEALLGIDAEKPVVETLPEQTHQPTLFNQEAA